MANYTIETRSLDILGVASHDFWVLRNSDTGKAIAELHGLATNRLTGEPEPIGTNDESRRLGCRLFGNPTQPRMTMITNVIVHRVCWVAKSRNPTYAATRLRGV